MKKGHYKAALFIFCFVALVLAFALVYNYNFPLLSITGESSAGTWLSGALLLFCAAFSLVVAMQNNSAIWYLVSTFFILLAADERFMFHEQIKEKIIFTFHGTELSRWIVELPVIIGALAGMVITRLLWVELSGNARLFLVCGAAFGTVSVFFDVFAAGVLFEEMGKLLAELCVTLSLLQKVNRR